MSKHTLQHRDPRLGTGYTGICAFCPDLVPLVPWLAIVVYMQKVALWHVEEDAKPTLHAYFTDLRTKGHIDGTINISYVRTR